jgi:hypothetical protein
LTVKLIAMSTSDGELPQGTQGVTESLKTNRQSWKNIGDKSRELKEQLLRLEEKLWGRKADETVNG